MVISSFVLSFQGILALALVFMMCKQILFALHVLSVTGLPHVLVRGLGLYDVVLELVSTNHRTRFCSWAKSCGRMNLCPPF